MPEFLSMVFNGGLQFLPGEIFLPALPPGVAAAKGVTAKDLSFAISSDWWKTLWVKSVLGK